MTYPLTPSSASVDSALRFHVRFKEGGWATLLHHPESGQVIVDSDWLTGAYWWPAKNTGYRSTLEFLATRPHMDYLCGKLFSAAMEVFDEARTRKNMLKRLGDLHPEWDEFALAEAEEELSGVSEHHIPDQIHTWYEDSDSPYMDMVYTPSPQWEMMNEQVMPALIAEVKKYLAQHPELCEAPVKEST